METVWQQDDIAQSINVPGGIEGSLEGLESNYISLCQPLPNRGTKGDGYIGLKCQ